MLDDLCFVSREGSGYLSECSDLATCWMVCVLYPGRGQDTSVSVVTRLRVGWSVFCIPGGVRIP
jgi:hypothetical protein